MEDNVRVVNRIFDILEQLSQHSSAMKLSEIATATGMSKSTVHRLISSMCTNNYVVKNSDNTYSIGYKLIGLVSFHINNLELLTEAKPFLNELTRDIGLTAHLGILNNCEVTYLDELDLYPRPQLYTQIGNRSPAVCSSIGKCLMACLSGDELDEMLYGYTFPSYTQNTITDLRELKRILRIVRKQGWAIDNEEYRYGHRCVGAPVFDYKGAPVAAISVSGSTVSLTDEKLESVITAVKLSAAALSRRLGYVE
ncbi:MAG: IclR family transcriptional regulator [Aminipila sp.]